MWGWGRLRETKRPPVWSKIRERARVLGIPSGRCGSARWPVSPRPASHTDPSNQLSTKDRRKKEEKRQNMIVKPTIHRTDSSLMRDYCEVIRYDQGIVIVTEWGGAPRRVAYLFNITTPSIPLSNKLLIVQPAEYYPPCSSTLQAYV